MKKLKNILSDFLSGFGLMLKVCITSVILVAVAIFNPGLVLLLIVGLIIFALWK